MLLGSRTSISETGGPIAPETNRQPVVTVQNRVPRGDVAIHAVPD